ncbi:hypothetical protein XI05_01680 [Bradyrhizobium sp. CCBAU 11357]|nr:hypothetical protein [Bradyrhizobium sp. CCBAU 11357]
MKAYFCAAISLLDGVTNGPYQQLTRVEGAQQIGQYLNYELWQLLLQNGFSPGHIGSSSGDQLCHFV